MSLVTVIALPCAEGSEIFFAGSFACGKGEAMNSTWHGHGHPSREHAL